jgi:hypothetical protein
MRGPWRGAGRKAGEAVSEEESLARELAYTLVGHRDAGHGEEVEMGGIYIRLERKIEGFDEMVDGKAASRAETQLEKISKKLGVVPLMEFFSASPEEMAEFEVELPDAPPAKFFDANEGLRTVQTLRAYLEKNPGEISDSARVLEDLRDFERVLSKAVENGIGWHLSVDT